MPGLPDTSRWREGVVAIDVPPTPAPNHYSSPPPKSQLFPTSTSANSDSTRHQDHYHPNQGQGSFADMLAALDRSPSSQPVGDLNSCPESIYGGFPGPYAKQTKSL
jgi:hypothetical protein